MSEDVVGLDDQEFRHSIGWAAWVGGGGSGAGGLPAQACVKSGRLIVKLRVCILCEKLDLCA